MSPRIHAALTSAPAAYRGAPPFVSLHDQIYGELRNLLMAGELKPGQNVSIRTMANKFGTSIIPVRDALRRLVAERALIMLPNRTVVVAPMTRRTFQEILRVRLCVETMLARQAAELITPDGINRLDAINEEMHTAAGQGDVTAYLLANQRFHFGLYACAQSTVALPIVESLWLQVGPFLNGVFTESGTAHARDNHIEILRALRRGDPIAASEAIKADLADAADIILASDGFFEE